MSTALANLAQAKQLLATSTDLREIADIKNKAEAIRAYLKASGESLETQNRAAEIRQRAIRRAGELLAKMEKHKGGRPAKTGSREEPVLADLDITKKQSHSWQKIAAVPEPVFEQVIAKCYSANVELTTSRIMSAARQLNKTNDDNEDQDVKRLSIVECISEARKALNKLAGMWPADELPTLVAILRQTADELSKEVPSDS